MSEKKEKRKREKNKKERKKEGIYKKGEWERKGMRVSQLALHTSKAILCARLQAVALHFSRKTFRHLAPPNLALVRLQSLAITLIRCQLCIASLAAPTHAKEKECSSYDLGLCYSTLFGTCSYAKKGDVLCTSNPKALCQQIMPPRSMVSTH